MILEKNNQQVSLQQQQQQETRRHLQQRNLQLAAAAIGCPSVVTGGEPTEDEDDGENDEENIVIDMADEDEEEDDEDYQQQQRLQANERGFDHQFGAISSYSNNNSAIKSNSQINNNNNDNNNYSIKYDKAHPMESAQNSFIEQQQDSSQAQSSTEPEDFHFNIGDLVWFDPNQLGYSIPGKVIDYYAGLTVITIEGYAQPAAELALTGGSSSNNGSLNYEAYNKLLLEADQELQVYDLSDLQQFKTLRLRLPLSDECGMSDLVDLDELTQESIIWNLKLRYKQELVYTRCGHKLLVSLNPYKQLSNVYNLDQVNKYDTINSNKLALLTATPTSANNRLPATGGGQSTDGTQPNSMVVNGGGGLSSSLLRWLLLHDGLAPNCDPAREEPHLFGLANEALKRLLISGQDQCFVLLGESGSGKTEASKLLVQYLATVNKSPTNLMTEQILESMQVLESFGNARTVHNDNSSRFGKLLDVRFNLNNGFIIDAKTIDLNLLDRTRIVSQAEGERNYHIFYELLAGLSRAEKEKYGLQSAEKYFYLNQGHCVELNGKEDSEDFRSLQASMQVLGFNYEEQDTIFRLLASVLHLGNIYFHRKVLAVRSGKLAQQLAAAGVEGVEIGSDTEVRWVSHLLQIQFDSVMRCLTVRTTEASGMNGSSQPAAGVLLDRIVTPLNIDQALDTRDAIARALYTCLFRWLIQRINAMINAEGSSKSGVGESENSDNHHYQQQRQHHNKEPVYLCRTSESLCEFQPDRLNVDQSLQSSLSRSQYGGVGSSSILSSGINRRLDESEPLVDVSTATMTILDAFGFENLAENNFEQLCINYTAELMHYHTNRYLIRLEQAEYAKERLRWEPISAQPTTANGPTASYQQSASNSLGSGPSHGGPGAIVNLISKKPLGILALLDDECNFPKATDQSFVEKCHHNHTLNDNYQRARLAANSQEFGIRHFRQPKRMVWYQVDGFIEKNRDSLRPDIVDLLVGSKMSIVADMLRKLHRSQELGAGAKTLSRTYDGRYVSMKPRSTTVAARFQDALHNNRVLESINCSSGYGSLAPGVQLPTENAQYSATNTFPPTNQSSQTMRPNPWFIVCLKPNQSKTEQVFDVAYVQDQVRSMGLLELAQIRKIGYPIRVRYGEFVRRYKCLVPQSYLNSLASCQDIQAVNRRLNKASAGASNHHQQQAANGHEIKRAIRDVCSAIVEYRFKQQDPQWVAGEARRQYQCGLTKMFLNERLFHEMEQMRLLEHQRAIQVIQKITRGWLVRREFLAERRAAIVIQAQLRGWLARREFWRQYLLIIMLQRLWRRQLIVRRRRALEARRKAQRQQQQLQLQELQAQQRQHADQFRHRLQPGQLAASRRQAPGAARAAGLDIPEELAQLYRLQRNWVPVHDLSHVNEIDLDELLSREQRRRKRHQADQMSVPFFVASAEDKPQQHGDESQQLAHLVGPELAHELESDDSFSLQALLLRYFTLDVPQFGYSRLPITRPFSWPQLARKRVFKLRAARKNTDEMGQVEDRLESVEMKAVAIYKLVLRYIDSDLNERTQTDPTQHPGRVDSIQKVIKFKLIADYIIYLCLNEPLLRDEIYLQLLSQSWQNPKPKSVENVWKLMVNCSCCFRPQDTELSKFLIRHANDYCCTKYRKMVLRALAVTQATHKRGRRAASRKYPSTMLEYWANQQAIDCLALATSCYMDDHALNGATYDQDEQMSPEEFSVTNHSNKTLVQIGSLTTAEGLATAVLRARAVPEANLAGWSVEVQHEGAQSEFSCRLRGDDQLLDHFSRLELLPEFASLIDDECQFNWVPPIEFATNTQQAPAPPPSQLNRRSTISGAGSDACSTSVSRHRKQMSASEFSAPHPDSMVPKMPVSSHHHQRQSMISHRSTDSSFISSRRQSSEVDLASASRLSQYSKLNRRYIRDSNDCDYSASTNTHQPPESDTYAPASHQGGLYHYHQSQQQQYQRPSHHQRAQFMSPERNATGMTHRRSMSMQELQLASSALNGRYFGRPQQQYNQPMVTPSGHYASSYVTSNSPYLRSHQSGSRNAGPLHQPAGGSGRRSQTPNSMSVTSAYGYTTNGQTSGFSTDGGGNHQSERRGRLTERGQDLGSLTRNPGQLGATAQPPRRSASSSSRTPRHGQASGSLSDYASACSDYERIGSNGGAARYATPSQASGSGHAASTMNSTQSSLSHDRRRLLPGNDVISNGAMSKKAPSAGRPQNPLIERYKLAAGQARSRRAPRDPEAGQNVLPPKLQQQPLFGHYMGSSAMSDSSEAPSLASHVRGIKAPAHNADLDQYLDDLFNPVLDEAGLDELSDARSLATSIRGSMKDAVNDDDLSILCDPLGLSRVIRGTEPSDAGEGNPNRVAPLSPTFESLLESLQGGSSQRASSVGIELADQLTQEQRHQVVPNLQPPRPPDANTSEVFNQQLGSMNLSELQALNQQLEHQIQAAQSSRVSLEVVGSSIPPPPPQPSFGTPSGDDMYSRAKTIRIGKWRWPPADSDVAQACDEPATSGEQKASDNSKVSLAAAAATNESKFREVELDAKLMPPPMGPPLASSTTQVWPGHSLDLNPGGSVGKLKISSEMKAKLEQLTNGSGSGRESATPAYNQSQQATQGIVSQATKSLMSASEEADKREVKRLAEQRKNLLEHQLLGATQGPSESPSTGAGDGEQPTLTGSKVLAVKQQLAAAAGVALTALDSGNNSQASSRRQSTAPLDPVLVGIKLDERRSRVLQDELGPQTRAAISQRQAFYQMSVSSDQLDHLAQKDHQVATYEHGGSEMQLRVRSDQAEESIPPPPQTAVSSDKLAKPASTAHQGTGNGSLSTKPAQLTRAMQMSNLSEAGQASETDGLYGQSVAKSMVQRQHESLIAAKAKTTVTSGGDEWISTSPDAHRVDPVIGQDGGGRRRPKRSNAEPGEQASKRRGSSCKQLMKQNSANQQQFQQHQRQQQQKQRLSSSGAGRIQSERTNNDRQFDQTPSSCLVYGNVDWQIKIRKEFFMPSETYDDPLVVQLVFAQLVADVFNPRHWTRLNNKERAAIKSLMKDNSIGYAPSLPQINQMQSVKQELVRMARSFGLYFTRSYPAFNFALIADQIQNGHQQRRGRRHSSMASSHTETSSDSSCDSDARADGGETRTQSSTGGGHSRQALRLMHRLRNANNLGPDWIDMVAVHHSGLRLVAVEQQSSVPARAPWSPSGGELATPTQLPPFGYRVLETLKYRDMTDVSQIGQHELLVSMRNGKKCWLISSDKAAQLGSLLRCFHADYNDHITASSTATTITAANNNNNKSSAATQFGKTSIQKKQQSAQAHKDALLAYDDDHHGDHIEQRQATDRIGRLHQTSHTNHDLADGERVLSNNLATNSKTSSKQLKSCKSKPTPSKPYVTDDEPIESLPKSASDGVHATNERQPGGQIDKKKSSASSKGHLAEKKPASAKKNLWQNSLSRMSNKFSIFGGSGGGESQSRASSAINGAKSGSKASRQAAATTCSASSLTPQVALDAWIETKVDFEEDEDDNENSNNNNNEPLDKSQVSMQLEEHERLQQQQFDQNDRSLPGQQQHQPQQQVDAVSSSTEAKSEDGKYSLLQFALYNFREAIDKYSLESRASKAPAQAGDTSTLRGSLKLIESLRSTRNSEWDSKTNQGTKERKSTGRGRLPLVTAGGSSSGSLSNDWTWRELAEMVKFTGAPIRQSLLKLPSDELNKRALDCFMAIMQYMGDAPNISNSKHHPPQPPIQGGEVECVYLILMNCHNYPILRDEIYCQLMKQTTSNRSPQPDSCLRGWRLFSIVAAYFDCSQSFKPYLLKYLETAAYDKRRAYCSVAALCLQNLRKTFKYNGRKNVPSIEEIAATSAGRNSKRQIYRLPGGTERVINTKSTTVVDDIIHEICSNMLNVTDPDEMLEFSLYCIADGDLYTMPLNRDEYILDITTELIKNHQQYFLIFCRSIWHYPLRLDSKLYIEVIFNQIAPDYLEGLLLVLPTNVTSRRSSERQNPEARQPLRLKSKLVKEVARIAALLHRASGTDYMPHKDEVKYLLPKPIISAMKHSQRVSSSAAASADGQKQPAGSGASSTSGGSSSARNESISTSGDVATRSLVAGASAIGDQSDTVITTPSKWVELVQNNWREMSAFDTLDAKAQFLDIIRHWPLFGSSFFAIKFIQRDLIQPMDYILALNKLGIQMLDMSTHETIHKYSFNEVISTRKVRSEDGALFLDLKCGNLMKRTIIRIQTDQAHEISRLIRQYIDIELLQQKQLQQHQQQLHQSSAPNTIQQPPPPTQSGAANDDGPIPNDLTPMPSSNRLSESESS